MNISDCCCEGVEVETEGVIRYAHAVLSYLKLDEVELSIVLCSNAFIQPLNRDYRGKDYATDVLSFSQQEGEGFENPMLGDVIISLEKTQEQAQERSKTFSSEFSLLLVHGILHLLGYDHEEDEEAEEMENKEKEILSALAMECEVSLR